MKVDFFIVGAPKSGTTSLYNYLKQHPNVEMSSIKEPDYFTSNIFKNENIYYQKERINNLDDYHRLFSQSNCVRGEASVSYLFYDGVAEDIFNYNNHAKIIIMLREPSDRAYSHYLMDCRLGYNSESFESIFLKKSTHVNATKFYQQYIQLGEYSAQLKRYLNVFGKKNVLVLDYESFKLNTENSLKKLFRFLNLNTNIKIDTTQKHNTFLLPKNIIIKKLYKNFLLRKLASLFPYKINKKIKNYLFYSSTKPKISDELKSMLNKYYFNDIKELEKVLNTEFLKWKK